MPSLLWQKNQFEKTEVGVFLLSYSLSFYWISEMREFSVNLACFCQRNWNQSHQQMDTDPTETTGHCPEVSRSSVPHQRQQVRHAYLRVRQQLRSTQDLHFWGRTCKICFHEVCWKYWILTHFLGWFNCTQFKYLL